MLTQLTIHLALLGPLVIAAVPARAAAVAAQESEPSLGELGPNLAARGQDAVLTWEQFDELSRRRHAMSETGRAALKHLLRDTRLVVLMQR